MLPLTNMSFLAGPYGDCPFLDELAQTAGGLGAE